jgi:hypothetical protein
MALGTFTELKTAVGDFLNRDDLGTTAATFIALSEADHARKLRHWRMEARLPSLEGTPINARFIDVPPGWLETIRFELVGYGNLSLVSNADMARLRLASNDQAGTPQYYVMSGNQFELYPTPDGDYNGEIVYFKQNTPLSDAAPTNWLLTYAPDAYLYGALVQSAPYLKDDARVTVWAALYQSAIDGLNDESNAARWSGTGLKMQIRGNS